MFRHNYSMHGEMIKAPLMKWNCFVVICDHTFLCVSTFLAFDGRRLL